jgi:glutathione S-transferase
MADYTLYYWPLPFRGQLVRAVLVHLHETWDEPGVAALVALKDANPSDQLIPHMGPPVLTDHGNGVSLAQTPAILSYLAHKHGLMPSDPVKAALTHKIVADANDVLYEMTRHNGAQMWTQEAWDDFLPRLARWMEIFEATGRRHGLTAGSGYLLGTEAPGVADLVAAILWGTMTDKFPPLRPMLEENAPNIAGLTERIRSLPEQASLREKSDAAYGNKWCGGQIEASLSAVLSQ